MSNKIVLCWDLFSGKLSLKIRTTGNIWNVSLALDFDASKKKLKQCTFPVSSGNWSLKNAITKCYFENCYRVKFFKFLVESNMVEPMKEIGNKVTRRGVAWKFRRLVSPLETESVQLNKIRISGRPTILKSSVKLEEETHLVSPC